MLNPRHLFEDTIRPADLLLRVYRLLECERIDRDGQLLTSLRSVVGATGDEELLLICNEIFVGLIRERAQITASSLKKAALNNLLRQAVVVGCTALDTYLPHLLRTNLPVVLKAKGRDFFPHQADLQDYFKELTFDLSETLRLLNDPEAPRYIVDRILSLTKFKYLSNKKGIHVVGSLLAIDKPWPRILEKLQPESAGATDTSTDKAKAERRELMDMIEEASRRRNDIVHRGDRPQANPSGPQQEISFVWAKQAVDTITNVCLALDDLVAERVRELDAMATA